MDFDYSRLKGRIVEKYGSQVEFAKHLGTSEKTVSDKINGKKGWRQDEIYKMINLLEIPSSSFFFRTKLKKFN